MEVHAVDIDVLCVHMSYIQFTLLGISAEVIHGNSLSNETFEVWYTMKYILNAQYRQYSQVSNEDEKAFEIKENENNVSEKVTLPCDGIENKILYSNEELEVFAEGRLF